MLRLLVLLMLFIFLAGCGGGGGRSLSVTMDDTRQPSEQNAAPFAPSDMPPPPPFDWQ